MDELQAREILKGDFDIIIPNFKKWNPDTRHHRHWMALSVDFLDDPKVMRLTDGQLKLWLRLLIVRAKSETSWTRVSMKLVHSWARVRGGSCLNSLLKLLELQLIELRCSPLQTNRQTNKHTSSVVVADLSRKIPKEVGNSSVEPRPILEELVGVEDELFAEMSLGAQETWVKEFGISLIKRFVPDFYSTWRNNPPLDRSGNIKPVTMWIRNCLAVEQKYAKSGGSTEINYEEICK